MDKGEVRKQLDEALKRHERGAVVMVEVPTDSYLDTNALLVDAMTSKTYDCIYLSLRPPFEKILSSLNAIPGKNKLFFIAAGGKAAAKFIPVNKNPDVEEIVWAIKAALPRLKSMKKFIFVDSLSSISENQPLGELLRLSEYLSRLVRKREIEGLILVFDSSYSNSEFIKDVALRVDEVIKIA